MEIQTINEQQRHFELVMQQAELLASPKNSIVPAAYRNNPSNIVAAGLFGRAFGWDVMTSMMNIHVIDGTASMKPEAMLGLVRRAGHSVEISIHPDGAVAVGKRADTGDEHTAQFTLADARNAGLDGKKNWKQYPEAMLQWRAVSKLCRSLFSDVVLGIGYVPEELGEETGPDGVPIELDMFVTSADAKQQLIDVFGKEEAIERWGDRGNNDLRQSELDELMVIDEFVILDVPEVIETPITEEETNVV